MGEARPVVAVVVEGAVAGKQPPLFYPVAALNDLFACIVVDIQ